MGHTNPVEARGFDRATNSKQIARRDHMPSVNVKCLEGGSPSESIHSTRTAMNDLFTIILNANQHRKMEQLMYNKQNLTKIKKLNELAPEVMKAFWAFDKLSVADGAIPVKYKELIAIAVALTTQCPYCIDIHSGNARKAGATEAEIAEAALVAASLRAGAAVTHATHALAEQ